MLSAIVTAGFIFAIVEASISLLIARVLLPSLVAGADLARLPEFRDQISMLIFGATALASGLAALTTARSARHHGRGLFAGAASAAIGIAGTIAIGVAVAHQREQPVVLEALVTHALAAGLGVPLGSLAGKAIFRGPSRLRIRTALPVALGALLAFQMVAPAISLAAAKDIPADTCPVVTWSGSLTAGLTAMSLDLGLNFDFEATQNLDKSWDLETAGGLNMGFKFAVGEETSVSGLKIPSLSDLTDLTRLHLEIANDFVGRVSYHYNFHSEADLLYAVAGSLATLSWQIQALPSLAALLPDGPVLPEGVKLPNPTGTTREFGGTSTVSLAVGPVSTSFEMANALTVYLDKPDPKYPFDETRSKGFEIGFAQSGTGTVSAETPGFIGETYGVDLATQAKALTYISFVNQTTNPGDPQWVIDSANLSVSGDLLAPQDSTADFSTQLLTQTDSGIAGPISASFKGLGVKIDHHASASLDARLEQVNDPNVAFALFRVILYSATLGATPSMMSDLDRIGRTVPQLRDPASEEQAIAAMSTLILHSQVDLVVRTSDSAKLGLKLGAGEELAFGAEIAAEGGRSALVAAFFMGDDLRLHGSKTCVAPD